MFAQADCIWDPHCCIILEYEPFLVKGPSSARPVRPLKCPLGPTTGSVYSFPSPTTTTAPAARGGSGMPSTMNPSMRNQGMIELLMKEMRLVGKEFSVDNRVRDAVKRDEGVYQDNVEVAQEAEAPPYRRK